MINLKQPVHYITEKANIFNRYCSKNDECIIIIPINKESYTKYGDFLEKYLLLILKLKCVVSGKYIAVNKISQLFYNLEYITYIAVGHGVCYFKYYLYADYRLYGPKINDKILIPPSFKIISLAKKYGWKEENIIKINLPRWDKYNNINEIKINNSIFIMFTWREIRKHQNISPYYIKNITDLIMNCKLIKILKLNNIKLYFSFHRYLYDKLINSFKSILKKNKNIIYVEQNEISNVLSQTNLVVSDFSSIIFDSIYRKKPYIIYIPDMDDPNINEIYSADYYELINSMKNNSFKFENIFYQLNKVIDKIIYYINYNFTLEPYLEKFYEGFELKIQNSTDIFIQYLKHL
jgi:CDP-glycerol glycerophosphotransferase (TagB/SpsB family)